MEQQKQQTQVGAKLTDLSKRGAVDEFNRDGRDKSKEKSSDAGSENGTRRRRNRSRSRSSSRDRRRGSRNRSRDRRRHGRRRSRSGSRERSSRRGLTEEEARMRDAKCVFVSQLQVKADERDVEFYFSLFCEVVEVALIREKSTGRSKGFGYVEFATIEDVSKALMLSGLPFAWRDGTKGFPLVVRPSEAYKQYLLDKGGAAAQALVQSQGGQSGGRQGANKPPQQNIELIEMIGPGSARAKVDGGPIQILPTHRGKPLNTRILYVGNLHKSLTESDLREIFSSFGVVENVQLKLDPNTGASKGFAFVRYKETAATATANEKLNGYELMGLHLSCNPVNDKNAGNLTGTEGGATGGKDEAWTYWDDDDPDKRHGGKGVSLGASRRVMLMSKLAGGAAQEWMSSVPQVSGNVGSTQQPTRFLAILNMFDQATETGANWEQEIEKDTKEECEKFGPVITCVVDKTHPLGRVLVTFQNVQDAKNCAGSLRGRWFAERQVQVEFLQQ